MFALKSADVGEIMLCNRTTGAADTGSTGLVLGGGPIMGGAEGAASGSNGRENGSSCCAVGKVGVCTISPQSSSSSSTRSSLTLDVDIDGPSNLLKSARESTTTAEGFVVRGITGSATVFMLVEASDTVAVRLCVT